MYDEIVMQFGYAAAWFFIGVAWIIVAGIFVFAAIATYGAMVETTKTASNAYYFAIWQRWLRRRKRERRGRK